MTEECLTSWFSIELVEVQWNEEQFWNCDVKNRDAVSTTNSSHESRWREHNTICHIPKDLFTLQEIWVEHWKLAAIIPIPSMLALWAGWREGKRFNTKVPDGAELRWPFKDCDFLSVCWSKQHKERNRWVIRICLWWYIYIYICVWYIFIYIGNYYYNSIRAFEHVI